MIKQKVRLYARVSTEEQARKKNSIPAQLNKLYAYCKENDYEVVNEYIDEGISASTIKKRKALLRMLNDLQRNDIILFTNLDRFSRNVLDANKMIEMFEPLNVSFKAIGEEDIDITTADGRFLFNLKVNLAERERAKVSERILTVFDYKLSQGKLINGRLPRGYTRSADGYAVINDDADFIRDVYRTFEDVRQIRTLTRVINNKYKLDLCSKTYRRILKQQAYIGLYRDKYIFPPIIKNEQFERVQRIFDGNTIKATKNQTYIFSGLIKCKVCGMRLGGSSSNGNSGDRKLKYKMYKCPKCQRGNGTHQCLAEKKLEKHLLPIVMDAIQNKIYTLSAYESQITQNRDIIDATKDKIKRLQDLYIDGKISKEQFDNKYEGLNKILDEESKKTNLKMIAKAKEDYEKLLNMNISEIYDQFDDNGKSVFWHSFIDYIVVNDYDNIDIFLQ
ncbi:MULTISPECIES: recombinase family protein [Bacillota]|uniref:Recombinase family protein n=1 Tax=[Eubacterium] hominis TaxID=2764325 RepID=A0A7G9GPR8_9FIRM|nr:MULTISPECIES: recombinase family protein [Bacillota]QNM12800.1 recombinase family protein [[Eubacterium] hominis]DAY68641.1 MAG TPA: integrase [Caudoviricetes sp.]